MSRCPHEQEPRGCYRVRCQLSRSCVEAAASEPAPAAQPSAEPIARVTGVHAGHTVVEPLNRAMVLPVGMALWSQPIEAARIAAQPSAEPTTECTTCGATVVRVTGVYDYPPPGEELVRAARDALAYMDAVGKIDMYPEEWAVAEALRRALDAEAKGGGR